MTIATSLGSSRVPQVQMLSRTGSCLQAEDFKAHQAHQPCPCQRPPTRRPSAKMARRPPTVERVLKEQLANPAARHHRVLRSRPSASIRSGGAKSQADGTTCNATAILTLRHPPALGGLPRRGGHGRQAGQPGRVQTRPAESSRQQATSRSFPPASGPPSGLL